MVDKSEALTTYGYQITCVTLHRSHSIKLPWVCCAWREGKNQSLMFDFSASCMKEHLKGSWPGPQDIACGYGSPGRCPWSWAQCLTMSFGPPKMGCAWVITFFTGISGKNLYFVVLQEGWHIWQDGMASGVGRVVEWMPHSQFPTATVQVSGIGLGILSHAQMEDNKELKVKQLWKHEANLSRVAWNLRPMKKCSQGAHGSLSSHDTQDGCGTCTWFVMCSTVRWFLPQGSSRLPQAAKQERHSSERMGGESRIGHYGWQGCPRDWSETTALAA